MGKRKARAKRHRKEDPKLPVIDKLYIRDCGHCWICGQWGPIVAFNRDHLIPKSLGGSDGLWNLRLTHPQCNSMRDRMPPPIDIVLQYCMTPGALHRAKKMYYRAYPHLKKNAISVGYEESSIVRGAKIAMSQSASETPGPTGHHRHPSAVCGRCHAWCGTCKACWCTAYENDHDVLKIRSSNIAVGIASPS